MIGRSTYGEEMEGEDFIGQHMDKKWKGEDFIGQHMDKKWKWEDFIGQFKLEESRLSRVR